jgi:ATP-binding cassette subfamily F protein uup
VDYPGTVLLVSHDRDFLNNVVTSTMVLADEGQVKEYAGGYDDWLRQHKPDVPAEPPKAAPKPSPPPRPKERPKLSYHEQRELEALPERIEGLEAEQQRVHDVMSDPAFYQTSRGDIADVTARLQAVEDELEAAYRRWEELEERKA